MGTFRVVSVKDAEAGLSNMQANKKPLRIGVDMRVVYSTIPPNSETGTPELPIYADVMLPHCSEKPAPVMLYIHGGGWIHSTSQDYPPAVLSRFQAMNFIVVSTEYRLCPETGFEEGMCEDVKEMENWLRERLGKLVESWCMEQRRSIVKVDGERVVVVGSSAGAHLALLTPKLWTKAPSSILSIYGPTDFYNIQDLDREPGREALDPEDCTPQLLEDATKYAYPQSSIVNADWQPSGKRKMMGQHIYRKGLLAPFLCRGLIKDVQLPDGQVGLRLPRADEVTDAEIEAISPLHLSQKLKYPPVYSLLGDSDHLFEEHHVHVFHEQLSHQEIDNEYRIVPGGKHGFDSYANMDDGDVDQKWLQPAVEWVAKYAVDVE